MKAPIPIARSEVALAAVGGKVHAIGGELPPNTFAENEAYDPKTASWRTLAQCLEVGTGPRPRPLADVFTSPPDR